MDKTVAVVLHYKNNEMTDQCVDSFLKTSPSVHILVVDNFSPTPYTSDKPITVIRNHTNECVNGMNFGFYHALYVMNADYVVNSDSDIICLDGWLEPLLEAMHKHPEVGILGGKQWNKDRTTHRSVGQDLIGGPLFADAPNTKETVMWIQGSFTMYRAEMMKRIGLHDERFEIICSDSDYCLHAKDRGWDVMFIPESEVIHYGGGSYGSVVPTWESDNTKLVKKWYGITAFEHLERFPYDINSKRRIKVRYELGE